MVGFLLYLHHSFHEIMAAAGNNGAGGYTGKCDYGELNPPGKAAIESALGRIPGDIPRV